MRICIICEGCYPYITGGVSSWVQMLMTQMPEHEFVVCAISADIRSKAVSRYKLPDNVSSVYDIYLNSYQKESSKHYKPYKMNEYTTKRFAEFLKNELTNYDEIFRTLTDPHLTSISSFMMSYELLDAVLDIYLDRYPELDFTSFFWTTRAMLLPFVCAIHQGIPKADLYHSVSTGYAGIMGCLGKYLYKKPFILTEHGIYTREREEEIIKSDLVQGCYKDMWISYFKSLSACAYRYADRVITLFSRNKEIEMDLGCEESKIRIIPNGVQVNSFKGLPGKDENDTGINIGAVVRLVPIKDIKTMILSFSLVKDAVPEAKFYIMGPEDEDEEYYRECQELVNSLGVKDLIFTGRVNIKEYIGRMDLLVLTSISEGQPLAILEGMASGKPFVSTDVGSCKELLYGRNDGIGRAGLIAKVMNHEEIAKAIISLCRDSEERARMGRNALERVSSYYTIESFINAYRDLYKEFEYDYGGNRIRA